MGPKTISAIEAFQRRELGLRMPDGRVDPGGRTIAKLVSSSQGRGMAATVAASALAGATGAKKSGKYWVTWANTHAKNSNKIGDLAEPFKTNAKNFIKALKDAGATVTITTTKRSKKRAYLFHWSWKISQGKCKASDATSLTGVTIQWDHGNEAASKKGALEMVQGFGLAVPPQSRVAPALNSNHIPGKAIDMHIVWTGTIKVKKKGGTEVSVPFNSDVNANTTLHAVGDSYGVKKLKSDKPHWSFNGH